MKEESPYKISQDLEIATPKKVKGYPISVMEWNLIKQKIKLIKDTTNIHFVIGGAFLGMCLSAVLIALTGNFPKTPNGEISARQIVCWAVIVVSLIAATLFFNSGRERRRIQKERSQDIIGLMEMIEGRFKKEGEEITSDRSEESTLFYDDFSKFTGWNNYKKGEVKQSNDHAYKERFSLKKDSYSDPHGGFKRLAKQTELGIVLSGWIYRPSESSGGLGDRLAVEDDKFNGYGFMVAHNANLIWIDRRDKGSPTVIGSQIKFTVQMDKWYQFKLYLKIGGKFDLRLYDNSGKEIFNMLDVTDPTYSKFDRIVVHGGYPYYIDDLKLEKI